MKHLNKIPMLLGMLVILLASCKKDALKTTPIASVNIINDVVNAGSVKANFASHTSFSNYFSGITAISYGSNLVYGTLAGVDNALNIVPSDTTQSILKTNLNLAGGGLYSLFLAGQTGTVDYILVQENLTAHTDSTAGVRFINLSYNSNPVIVTLSATPTVTEFTSLPYKSISPFKTYSGLAANSSYTFQVRDASTNVVLVTYTLATPRFNNVTLVLKGVSGVTSGTNALGIQLVKNY